MVLNLLSVCSHTGPVSQDLAQALNSFTRENFLMLDRILSPAAALSAPVIEFFNNFPMSLKHLRQKLGLGPLKDLFATASFTLNCLQNRLAAMRDYFTAEKTLPLFQDMFDILGFQSINPFAKEAWSMFNTHKRNYFDHGSLGTEAANEARNQYKQLYQRHVPLQQQPHRHRQQSRQAAGVHQNEVAPFGAIPLNHGQLGGQIALHGYNPPYGPMQTLPRVLPNMHGTPTNAGIPMQPQCFGHTPFGNMTSNNVQVHTLPFNQAQLPASTSYNIGVQAPPQQANSGAARPAPQTNASSQFGTSGQILRVQALNAVGNMTTRPNPGLPHLNNLAIGRPLPLQKPTPFVPPEGFRPMIPARPDPGRAALHQAHLRSPILRARTLMSGQSSLERLYRYVDGFALLPKQLSEKLSVQEFRFIVDAAELDPPPKLQVPDNGTAGTKSTISGQLWRAYGNIFFFKLNGTVLEARRKLQHGRELPIDITNVLRPGENVLTVLVNRTSADKTPFRYAVAVETVLFASGDAIKQDRTAHATVSDVDVLANIKSSLSRSGARDGDDEIMVLQTNITIPLFEPFSNARIFDLPVRGESCAHRQAFDLAMFLETRPTVSKGAFSQVDVWKCPFCNGDVRPNKLVVDGFLVRVRADLEAKRMLDTRAIVVESDGSWKPRIDPIDARAEDEDETTEQRKDDEGAASATPKKSVDVIEIDSD
ncbi:hypothetical protein H2203_000413 [Taxawa tesnikishii (nom. ined.)]|nr:hypothetical protein H2203_000413 [Dothideales sp. JES 119]